ncbi:MAG: protein translocase subunit SecF, partial [Bryobacteraceae bacterium]
MELFKNTNFDFLGKKWPFIIASMILTAAGLVSLVARGGPRYGIDFRGGALVYVKFLDKPMPDKVRSALASKIPGGGAPEVVEVQGTNELIIGTEIQDEKTLAVTRQAIVDTLAKEFGQSGGQRMDINNAGAGAIADRLRDGLQRNGASLSEQQLQDLSKAIAKFRDTPPQSGLLRNFEQLSGVSGVTPAVIATLNQEFYTAPYAIRNVELVGAKIGADLRHQAVYVVLSALAGMLIYIAFRFEWIYGVAAVLAVFHDTIITIGLFSLFNMEISLTVVAALLTLVGYSMNDTIVVFDRIRENLKLMRREKLENLINISVNQTLSRTLLTSGLTFLTALSLF